MFRFVSYYDELLLELKVSFKKERYYFWGLIKGQWVNSGP